MPFANKTGQERMDHAYDPVPGEPPIAPMPDYELGAPYSWFEYETDNRLHSIMVHDQVNKIAFLIFSIKTFFFVFFKKF